MRAPRNPVLASAGSLVGLAEKHVVQGAAKSWVREKKLGQRKKYLDE